MTGKGGSLLLGEQFTFVFHCFDVNGNPINSNIVGLEYFGVFTNTQRGDEQIFVPVDPLQNGLYRVSYRFYLTGAYQLKVYFGGLLIY